MRSLGSDRRSRLITWIAFVAVVAAIQIASAPTGYRSMAEMQDLAAGDRESIRHALHTVHLTSGFLGGWWLGVAAITSLIYVTLGTMLVRRGQPAGFSFYLAIVMMALTCASYPPDIDKLYPDRPFLQASVLTMTAIAVSGFFLMPLVFPNGRFVPRWTWLLVPYLVGSIFFLDRVNNSVGPVVEAISTICLVVILLGSAIYRYRKISSPEQRLQTRWVLFGFLIGLPAFFLSDAMMRSIYGSARGIAMLAGFMVLNPIGFSAPFLAISASVLANHLFDIDVILNRTLVWIAMTVVVVGVYIGIVIGIGQLIGSERDLVLSLVATGLVAVAFQPLRNRVQRFIDRFLFGDRNDPYAALARLGHRIEGTLDPSDLLPQIVRTTAEVMRLPYVALLIDRTSGLELAAATGTRVDPVVRLPLTYQGTRVGEMEVAPRSPGETLGGTDRRLLDDLARQIGIAAHAVTLAQDLQLSREQLVASREEERRILRRDLHDGLGPQLAALLLQTSAVRNQIESDPDRAMDDLDGVRDEIRQAIAEIRRLSRGLRPPTLDELGLAGAIRSRIARMQIQPVAGQLPKLAVHLNAPEHLEPIPAAVEVALLRIVDEALANVVHHARATEVVVRLEQDEHEMRLSIEDNGQGCEPAPDARGLGLRSMRERTAELGGSFAMTSAGGGRGCRIAVTIPTRDRR